MTGRLLDATCPRCGKAEVRYSPAGRAVACRCGWGIAGLLPGPATPLLFGAARGENLTDYLRQLATLPTGPAPEPPPTVISTRRGGYVKARRIPPAGGYRDAAERLEALAEQFALNGGTIARHFDGTYTATSQQRSETDLTPATGYTLRLLDTGYRCTVTCSCPAPGGTCAHRAGLRALALERLADAPDLTAGMRALYGRIVRGVEEAAGVRRPARLSETAARADLYGEATV